MKGRLDFPWGVGSLRICPGLHCLQNQAFCPLNSLSPQGSGTVPLGFSANKTRAKLIPGLWRTITPN